MYRSIVLSWTRETIEDFFLCMGAGPQLRITLVFFWLCLRLPVEKGYGKGQVPINEEHLRLQTLRLGNFPQTLVVKEDIESVSE